MASRYEIIEIIGKGYHVSNLENGEFSYPKALKKVGKEVDKSLVKSKDGKTHSYLDIRFVKDNITILVETKNDFNKWKTDNTLKQLQSYVNYEKVLTNNKMIAILVSTEDKGIKVWWGSHLTIDEAHQIKNQNKLKTFDEYAQIYNSVKNDKEEVLTNTYKLNEMLHKYGVKEKLRSQFVGGCLLALKNGLTYKYLTSKQILGGIEEVITDLLNKDSNKTFKLDIFKKNILKSQDIKSLSKEGLQEIIEFVDSKILPHINERSTVGQDILNLFFTTFNKYVGKADKNQAFTPDHIVHFMCQVVGVNRTSRVLDPCCGSGAFLVRAMTEAMDDCSDDEEREEVKQNNIFGIEYEETAFGLASMNMLIHGDGKSNVRQGSCFDLEDFIKRSKVNVVLMNPPYNAQRKHSQPSYVENWKNKISQDPSKGFHFVYYVASLVKTGKLAVLLPMKCAIGGAREIDTYKSKMLEEHTLDAVFSLPEDMFHPGANAIACCMIFNLGARHEKSNQETFFGYFRDDGFVKKKNLGRVEKTKSNSSEGIWADIESKWLSFYKERKECAGISVTKKISCDDEWCAEAYMETDYSKLTEEDFIKTIKNYVAFEYLNGRG